MTENMVGVKERREGEVGSVNERGAKKNLRERKDEEG